MPISGETVKEIDEARGKEDLKKLEAVLFISGRFLTVQELISYTDLNPILLKELIEELTEKYEKNDSAIEIISKGDMWKMNVKPEYSNTVNRFAAGRSEFSKAEQETLAIIALKKPIKQSVVIKIRGNKAYEHIKNFVELGLLKKKKFGHTWELDLGDDFYDYFSVSEENILKRQEEGSE